MKGLVRYLYAFKSEGKWWVKMLSNKKDLASFRGYQERFLSSCTYVGPVIKVRVPRLP